MVDIKENWGNKECSFLDAVAYKRTRLYIHMVTNVFCLIFMSVHTVLSQAWFGGPAKIADSRFDGGPYLVAPSKVCKEYEGHFPRCKSSLHANIYNFSREKGVTSVNGHSSSNTNLWQGPIKHLIEPL